MAQTMSFFFRAASCFVAQCGALLFAHAFTAILTMSGTMLSVLFMMDTLCFIATITGDGSGC
jgi:hypothetical protein